MISIIVPVYNAEKYIAICVQSILEQTYTCLEVLLIDDGSFDKSGRICDELASSDSRVKVFHQKNNGVSSARNVGLKKCCGRYVVFVDADDIVSPYYVENLICYMNPGGIVVSNVCNNELFLKNSENVEKIILSKQCAIKSIFHNGVIQGVPFGKIFDLKLIREQKILFDENIAICEDMLFIVEYLSFTTNSIVKINTKDYFYRNNEMGALNGRFTGKVPFNKKWLNEFEAFEKAEVFLKQMPQVKIDCQMRKAKAAVTTLRTMVANHYEDEELYVRLLSYARKSLVKYLKYNKGAFSSCISMICGCVSPSFELWVYNIIIRIKAKTSYEETSYEKSSLN